MNILLVDDEIQILETYSDLLESLGYQVTSSNSSPGALQIFMDQPGLFSLVITDFQMPELNGLELAGKLSQLNPGLPIIMISGLRQFNQQEAAAAGIAATAVKPVGLFELDRLINRAIHSV